MMLSNEILESCVSPGRAPAPAWRVSVLGKGREQKGEEFSVLSKIRGVLVAITSQRYCSSPKVSRTEKVGSLQAVQETWKSVQVRRN